MSRPPATPRPVHPGLPAPGAFRTPFRLAPSPTAAAARQLQSGPPATPSSRTSRWTPPTRRRPSTDRFVSRDRSIPTLQAHGRISPAKPPAPRRIASAARPAPRRTDTPVPPLPDPTVRAPGQTPPAADPPAIPTPLHGRFRPAVPAPEPVRYLPDLGEGPVRRTPSPIGSAARIAPRLPAILFEGDQPEPAEVPVDPPRPGVAMVRDRVTSGAAPVDPVPRPLPPAAGPVDTPPAGGALWGTDSRPPAGAARSADPMPAGAASVAEPTGSGLPGAEAGLPPVEGSLWLTARDPFCVVAHWTFDREALERRSAGLGEGDWRLRVWRTGSEPKLVAERELPPGSTFSFVPVPWDGTAYGVELGHRAPDGGWRGLDRSEPAVTPARISPSAPAPMPGPPPEPMAPPVSVPWGAVDAGMSAGTGSTADSAEARPVPGLAGAREQAPRPGPAPDRVLRPAWAEEEVTLTRWAWGELQGQLPESSEAGVLRTAAGTAERRAVPGLPEEAPGGPGPSSGDAGLHAAVPEGSGSGRDFWLEVNAEVILYGRTAPDARVTVAGRPVVLRPDGSFSFRFLLPDGCHPVPVAAVSADGTDARSARVLLGRETAMGAGVAAAPVDPVLHPPGPDAIG